MVPGVGLVVNTKIFGTFSVLEKDIYIYIYVLFNENIFYSSKLKSIIHQSFKKEDTYKCYFIYVCEKYWDLNNGLTPSHFVAVFSSYVQWMNVVVLLILVELLTITV